MTPHQTLAVRTFCTDGITDGRENLHDLLHETAVEAAAKRGRVPVWPPREVTSAPASDGLVQVDAIFDTKEQP